MLDQIFIAVFGVAAVFLTQVKNDQLKKYACIFGLLSQPFWFYSAYVNQQWGIFALCFFYAAAWIVGFKNYWLTSPVPVPPVVTQCHCGRMIDNGKPYCWDCEHEEWLDDFEPQIKLINSKPTEPLNIMFKCNQTRSVQ